MAEITCQYECSPLIAFPPGLQTHMVYVTVSFPERRAGTKAFPQEVVWLFTALELEGPITPDTLTQSNELGL